MSKKFKSVNLDLDFKELNIIKHGLERLVKDNQEAIRNSTTLAVADKQTDYLVDNKLTLNKIVRTLDQFYIREDKNVKNKYNK